MLENKGPASDAWTPLDGLIIRPIGPPSSAEVLRTLTTKTILYAYHNQEKNTTNILETAWHYCLRFFLQL